MSWLTNRDRNVSNRKLKNLMDLWLEESWPFDRRTLQPFTSENEKNLMFSPKIDVHEHEGKISIKAELPGVKKDDIEVSVDHNNVLIKGEKKLEKKTNEKDYEYYECSYGSFQRSIPLPYEVDMEKIKADFDNGILGIELEKEPMLKEKSRKISL